MALMGRISHSIGAMLLLGLIAGAGSVGAAPRMIAPPQDFNLTDVALSFRWFPTGAAAYDLEVSTDQGFASKALSVRVNRDAATTQISHMPFQLLPPGTYFWRVKDAATGDWSAPIRFRVNAEHPKVPLVRPITPDRPMFTLSIFGRMEQIRPLWSKFWAHVPEDLRPFVSLSFERSKHGGDVPIMEFYQAFNDMKIPSMELTGGPNPKVTYTTLAEMEWMFQNVPASHGVMIGEQMWDYGANSHQFAKAYFRRAVILCAKYGKTFVWGDGNYSFKFRWDRFLSSEEGLKDGDAYFDDPAFLREHKAYFNLEYKNNVGWNGQQTESVLTGAWLAGIVEAPGLWSESFWWKKVSYAKPLAPRDPTMARNLGIWEDMPPVFWCQMFIQGLAKGASLFNLDGQGNTTVGSIAEFNRRPTTAIWDRAGNITPVYTDILLPFMRFVVQQRLVPSKEEVFSKIKVAVRRGPLTGRTSYNIPGNVFSTRHLGQYQGLYLGTYGLDDVNRLIDFWDLIPNSSRYYYIPILPHPVATLDRPGVKVVDILDVDTEEKTKALFDQHYPPTNSTSYAMLPGNKFFIMTSKENTDVTQRYDIPVGGAGALRMKGEVGPHKYIMGRFEENGAGVVLQTNTHWRTRDTEIEFHTARKPERVVVTPAAAQVASTWDGAKQVVRVRYSAAPGPVEIRVDVTGTGVGILGGGLPGRGQAQSVRMGREGLSYPFVFTRDRQRIEASIYALDGTRILGLGTFSGNRNQSVTLGWRTGEAAGNGTVQGLQWLVIAGEGMGQQWIRILPGL